MGSNEAEEPFTNPDPLANLESALRKSETFFPE